MTAGVADEYGPARRKLDLLVHRTLAFYEGNAEFVVLGSLIHATAWTSSARSASTWARSAALKLHANLRRVFATWIGATTISSAESSYTTR